MAEYFIASFRTDVVKNLMIAVTCVPSSQTFLCQMSLYVTVTTKLTMLGVVSKYPLEVYVDDRDSGSVYYADYGQIASSAYSDER